MRQIIFAAALAGLVAGCGSSGGGSTTPTAAPVVATKSYHDPTLKFSFKYPADWSIQNGKGHTVNSSTGQSYVVDLNVPNNVAGMSVEVDGQVMPLPAFKNGHHGTLAGDPHTYIYYHDTVAQWPAMRVERYTAGQLSEMDTIANTRHESYDIRMNTATPPFPASVLAGYRTIVRSFKMPFS